MDVTRHTVRTPRWRGDRDDRNADEDRTITTDPDLHGLAGAYALDAVDDDEREAFEAHLAHCEACREELDGLVATAARLGSAVTASPPAHLKGRLLDIVARTPQQP